MRLMERIKNQGMAESGLMALRKLSSMSQSVLKSMQIHKAKLLSKSCYIVKEIQGSKMLLDLNDHGISRELFFTGVHEPESTRQLKEELRPGMNILEIGANIGYYSLIEVKIIGETGHIIAFEPSEENIKTLRLNVALNNFQSNIETHQMAVGSENGQAKFYCTNKGNTSSLYNRETEGSIVTTDVIMVDVVSIDSFFKNRRDRIDLFRMDVEGYEYEIIKGMQNFLSSEIGPQKCFIEIHSRLLNENGYTTREFINFLESFNYKIKTARYRGKPDICTYSNSQLLEHQLCERGYWEAFFEKSF